MTVSVICNHNVATIPASDGVTDAAVRMREEHVGTLLVVERSGSAHVPVGIVTAVIGGPFFLWLLVRKR